LTILKKWKNVNKATIELGQIAHKQEMAYVQKGIFEIKELNTQYHEKLENIDPYKEWNNLI